LEQSRNKGLDLEKAEFVSGLFNEEEKNNCFFLCHTLLVFNVQERFLVKNGTPGDIE